jgi:3-oxoacyl-[acyl-carrier-protein] synthase II
LRQLWQDISPGIDPNQAAIISGASGAEPATSAELAVLTEIGLPVRSPGTYIGHGLDAHFVACLAIACAAIEHGKLFAPAGSGDRGDGPAALRQAAVTSVGTWRGEGVTLIERAS